MGPVNSRFLPRQCPRVIYWADHKQPEQFAADAEGSLPKMHLATDKERGTVASGGGRLKPKCPDAVGKWTTTGHGPVETLRGEREGGGGQGEIRNFPIHSRRDHVRSLQG